ncbi:MAG: 3-coathanger stack domain-containing protein, partial [Bacteroidota bacterium]
ADVGQGDWEEVNFQPASSTGGENYGWRCYEGNHAHNTSGCGPMNAYDFPVFEYPHNSSTGGFSITGGYVYRGTNSPDLNGWYVVADYSSDNFWLLRPNGLGGFDAGIQTNVPVADISTFGEDEAGELYAASLGGAVYSVTAIAEPCPADSTVTFNPLHLETVSASDELTTLDTVNVPPNATVTFRAGTGITLAPGFSTRTGANFSAIIENCGGAAMPPTPNVDAALKPDDTPARMREIRLPQHLLQHLIFGNPFILKYSP